MEKSYYEILGIKPSATQDEIKKAFRKKALKTHPDRIGSTGNQDEFKSVNLAYETLRDPIKRLAYDRQRESPSSNYSDGVRTDFRWPQPPPWNNSRKGQYNIYKTIQITLEQAMSGKGNPKDEVEYERTKIEYYRNIVCPYCNGSGCEHCSNSGVISERTFVNPQIPPGAKDDGECSINLSGKGHQNPSTREFGDLILNFKYIKHPIFRVVRHNRSTCWDIEMEYSVNIIEFLLNRKIKIKNVDGNQFELTINDKNLSSGQIRVIGKGLPDWNDNNVKGNLYVFLKWSFPELKELSSRERKLLEMLLECKNFKPNE